MTWRPWRRKVQEATEAVRAAERLRDTAQAQQRAAERLTPRVAAVSASLEKFRSNARIDAILRGSE